MIAPILCEIGRRDARSVAQQAPAEPASNPHVCKGVPLARVNPAPIVSIASQAVCRMPGEDERDEARPHC